MQVSSKPSDERKPREKGPAPPPPPAAKEVRPAQPKPVKDDTDSNRQSQVSVPVTEVESKPPKDLKTKEDIHSSHQVAPIPPAPIAPVAPVAPVTPLPIASEPREADVPFVSGSGDATLPSSVFPVVPSDANTQNFDNQSASGETVTLLFTFLSTISIQDGFIQIKQNNNLSFPCL